jgi:hypothetical protein
LFRLPVEMSIEILKYFEYNEITNYVDNVLDVKLIKKVYINFIRIDFCYLS